MSGYNENRKESGFRMRTALSMMVAALTVFACASVILDAYDSYDAGITTEYGLLLQSDVSDVPVSGIELDRTSATIRLGETFTLHATVLPPDATNKNIGWASANNSIATVDENGVVKGVAEGTTKVAAITEEGSHVAVCEVTVSSPAPLPDNGNIWLLVAIILVIVVIIVAVVVLMKKGVIAGKAKNR